MIRILNTEVTPSTQIHVRRNLYWSFCLQCYSLWGRSNRVGFRCFE